MGAGSMENLAKGAGSTGNIAKGAGSTGNLAVGAGSAASLFYPYGLDQKDQKNPKLDDGSSKKLSLAVPFTFYSKQYQTLYVNNNGVISFGSRVNQYTPDPFPLADGRSFVAPYWGDVDNVLGGDVFYRETTDPELLGLITKQINQYFPDIPFTATWAFVATWARFAPGSDSYGFSPQIGAKRVPPFYLPTLDIHTKPQIAPQPSQSADMQGNTFQAALTTDTKTSFIILNYKDIQWTTGAASGGDAETGLGGTPAHVRGAESKAEGNGMKGIKEKGRRLTSSII
ncbi:Alpha-tectorin [Anas platyrhynchos]|uniref:Alpha-tectorin n=1 Tax=Anas platyrhynchos TaxID=8839 RepID=R0KZP5_ANAPL|nr:Alpha-tectorin [Anas platyrhynchos]